LKLVIGWTLGSLTVLSVGLVFAGCGGGGEDEIAALNWSVFKQLGPNKVRLAGEVDYCVGDPKPRIERAITRYSGNRAFLTLLLAPQQRAESKECRGLIMAVYKTITFERPLNKLILLDSSTDPPERRWPD
jgi:hypothetical protein